MKRTLLLIVAFVGIAAISVSAQEMKKADVVKEQRDLPQDLNIQVPAAKVKAPTGTATTPAPAPNTNANNPAAQKKAIITESNRVNIDPAQIPAPQPVKQADTKPAPKK